MLSNFSHFFISSLTHEFIKGCYLLFIYFRRRYRHRRVYAYVISTTIYYSYFCLNIYLFFFLFLRRSFALVTQAGVQWPNLAHCNLLHLLGSSNSPALASHVAGIIGARHHTWLILVFLVEMGLHHVGQAGFKLLTS